MSKQSVGPRPQSGGTPAAGSREESDLRLQRQLQLNQQAQLELSQAQTQLSYCGHFLKVVREQLQEMRSSCLLARSSQFAGWEGRIRQFTVAAIHHKMPPPEQPVRSQAVGTAKKGQCSQGAHLREVLQGAAVEREQEEIAQLEQKLELLYDRISTALKE